MKKEYFAATTEEALLKASKDLGVPRDSLDYETMEHSFGSPLGQKKVVVLVEMPDVVADAPAEEVLPDLSEEEEARSGPEQEWAKFLVDGIFRYMGLQSKTTVQETESHVVLTVDVHDFTLDLRRGDCRELRGAIQHIVNRSLSRSSEDGRRYIVDIGGTLEARSKEVAEIASEMENKITSLQKGIHIHLMDSQDRRLLHLALVKSEQTRTEGRGEKQFRVLTLEPADKK